MKKICSQWKWYLGSEQSKYSFRVLLSLCALGLITPSTGVSATIKGRVRAEGKTELEAQASGGKYASRKFKFVERVDYTELNDIVVYIELPAGEEMDPPDASA